jgi:hypothetical protein
MQPILSHPEKPSYVIFLNIDGVLMSEREKQLALAKPSEEACKYADSQHEFLSRNTNAYSNNYWSLIVACHFSKKALENLNKLIERIEQVAKPLIVISSRWRLGRTLDELIRIYFKMYTFSRYIADKIPDKIPGKDFPSLRLDEIRYWLDCHPEIKHYIIFNDEPLDQTFEKHCIVCHGLLSEQDIEKVLNADPLLAIKG